MTTPDGRPELYAWMIGSTEILMVETVDRVHGGITSRPMIFPSRESARAAFPTVMRAARDLDVEIDLHLFTGHHTGALATARRPTPTIPGHPGERP